MKDDGARLSITGDYDSFTVTDNLTNKTIICTNGQFIRFDIDKEVVCNHLNNLQQLLTTANKRHFGYKAFGKFANKEGITVMERDHYEYRIICSGKCADLNETTLHCQYGFDVYQALRFVGRIYSKVIQADKSLNPARDIVRRIVDVGVLVWVHDGHSIVCYEDNIEGLTMSNCLIDGNFYNIVMVSVNAAENRCTLFDAELNIIVEYPLDDSILTYYKEEDYLLEE